MTNKTTYYTVKLGDSLWDISKKTGIPYEALTRMKGLRNLDEINPGDQIVWQDGIATYENHLYGPLSQEEKPQAIASDKPTTEQTVPSEKPAPVAPPTDKEEGSRSTTKSCEVCDNKDIQCLCEVTLDISKTKDGSSQTYYWKSRKEGRLPIPKVIVAPGFPNSTRAGVNFNGEETTVNYKLAGCCEGNLPDKCVQSEILTVSASDGKYKKDKKPGGKTGNIDLTYDEGLKLYADITPKSIDIYPTEQGGADGYFIKALKFLMVNELFDYPVNYRKFSVAECDKKGKVNTEKVVTHFVSTPLYEVSFDISCSFQGEKVKDLDLVQDGTDYSPARFGKFTSKPTFTIKHNRVETKTTLPEFPDLSTIPVMNKVSAFLNKLETPKTAGKPITSVAPNNPALVAASIRLPKFTIKVDASFAEGNALIERKGTLELNPLFGVSAEINIFNFLTKIGGTLGTAVKKGVKDIFKDVHNTSAEEHKKRDAALRAGRPERTGVHAAAFFYIRGTIDCVSTLNFTPSKLGDFKLPFDKLKLGVEVGLGLYAGVFAEAKIWGFGGSFSAGLEISTKWTCYYYFDEGLWRLWHDGVAVKVYAEAEVGKDSGKDGKDYGSAGDNNASARAEWSGIVWPGGSEKNPLYGEPLKAKPEDYNDNGNIKVNIKDKRDEESRRSSRPRGASGSW